MLSNKELLKFAQIDFMESIFNGDTKRIRLLLDLGVNPNHFKKDDTADSWTPLMHAACSMHFEIVEALINAGADVNAVTIDGGLKENVFKLLNYQAKESRSGHSLVMVKAMKKTIRECVKAKERKSRAVVKPHGPKPPKNEAFIESKKRKAIGRGNKA